MSYKDLDKKREQERKWRRANPEKSKAMQKKWRDKHPEQCSPRAAKWNRAHRSLVNKRAQNSNFKRKFGITLEDKNRILFEQGGRCAICGAGEFDKIGPWCMDHDHKTKALRGVLCRRCNMALGALEDKQEILEKMIAYLYRHQPATLQPSTTYTYIAKPEDQKTYTGDLMQ